MAEGGVGLEIRLLLGLFPLKLWGNTRNAGNITHQRLRKVCAVSA